MAISNTTIQIKKSVVSGNTPSSLANGEIAINSADGKLFYRTPSGSISFLQNSLSFSTINANSSLILAGTNSDTLSIVGVNGVSVTGNSTTKTVTVDGSSAYNLAASAYAAANAASSGITASQYVTRGTLTGNQSLNTSADTVILFNTASFDPQGWLNTSTGSFKPTIAGYYSIKYVAWFTQGTAGTGNQYNLQIHKNATSGNTTAIVQQTISGNNGQTLIATDTIYLNGTTDYVAFSAYSTVAGQSVQASSGQGTYFIAELDGVSTLANSVLAIANSAQSNAQAAFNQANIAYAAANSALSSALAFAIALG